MYHTTCSFRAESSFGGAALPLMHTSLEDRLVAFSAGGVSFDSGSTSTGSYFLFVYHSILANIALTLSGSNSFFFSSTFGSLLRTSSSFA